MTSNLLIATSTTGESCTSVAGWGMVTQWTMNGSTTEYTGSLPDTDGYMMTAAMTWVSTSAYLTSRSGESLSGFDTVYGTCVASVDDAGNTQLDTVIDEGNQVICHWLYYKGGATMTTGYVHGDTT